MTTLGKRSRNSRSFLRRTTSMSELPAEEQGRQQPARAAARGGSQAPAPATSTAAEWGSAQRSHSGDFPVAETTAFLKACGRCHRRLGPGRDTYIYMGEVAFCSHECRQKQMNLDELKEKCYSAGGGGGGPDQSGSSGTIAAA